jgi:ribosome-associated heat shock protein Hsp15
MCGPDAALAPPCETLESDARSTRLDHAFDFPSFPLRHRRAGGTMNNSIHAPPAGVRLDVWLWAARFFKTRALAKQAIEGGKVEVNGAAGKPGKVVHAGAALRITRGEERFEIEVLALAEQRGPAALAQQLYRETEASRAAREAAIEQRRLLGADGKPKTKPDKRARRLIRALGDIDAL